MWGVRGARITGPPCPVGLALCAPFVRWKVAVNQACFLSREYLLPDVGYARQDQNQRKVESVDRPNPIMLILPLGLWTQTGQPQSFKQRAPTRASNGNSLRILISFVIALEGPSAEWSNIRCPGDW